MYFIYIIYSESSDKYYLGYSGNPWRRIIEHNSDQRNTFTSKYRPWIFKGVFQISDDEKDAIEIERFLKKQKSKKLIEKIIQSDFVGEGILAQMVRVPHVRD